MVTRPGGGRRPGRTTGTGARLVPVPATDTDLAAEVERTQAVIELRLREASLRGALRTASRVLQPSLVDFLR